MPLPLSGPVSPKALLFRLIVALLLFPAAALAKENALPAGFVYLHDIAPEILVELRYYSENNFVGARIDGYHAPVAILTVEAAQALKKAHELCAGRGYAIKVFDAYRPQRAVNHFVRWSKDAGDTKNKRLHYPHKEKSRLFKEGYIASRSGHSTGDTVDVTLVSSATGQELDMGTPFDFFGPASHHATTLISAGQTANREILRAAMTASGFAAYTKEWWHYSLRISRNPKVFYDFPVR